MTNFRRAAATAATALMAFNTGAIACTTGCGQSSPQQFAYNPSVDVRTAFTGTQTFNGTLSNTGTVTGTVDSRNTNTFAPTVEGSKAQAQGVGDVKVNVVGDTYTAPKPAVSSAIAYAPQAGICANTGAFAVNFRDFAFSVSGSAKQDFCIGAVYTIVPTFERNGMPEAGVNYVLQGDAGARTAFARAAQMEENEAARAAAGLPPLGKYARYLATGVAPLEVKSAVAASAPAAYTP